MVWVNGKMIKGEPVDVYHARKETSASRIKDFRKSPKGYFRKYYLGIDKDVTSTMELGTAVHEDVLLEAVERSYVIIPKDALATNGAKLGNAWKEFKAANQGRILLKDSEVIQITEMKTALASHPLGKAIFKPGVLTEITLTAEAPVVIEFEGERKQLSRVIRSRLDYLDLDECSELVLDLKTTGDLSNMRYLPYDLGWDIQASVYRKVVYAATGLWVDPAFIVVENKEPFRCEVWQPLPQTLAAASEAVETAIADITWREHEYARTGDQAVWERKGFDEVNWF